MSEQKHTPTPPPWEMLTGNSFRRIGAPKHGRMVCEPTFQRHDGHPDLHFANGGFEGPDAKLMLKAPNAIQNAAHRLGVDPLTLAERLEDGGIAELVQVVRDAEDAVNGDAEREQVYRIHDTYERWHK